MSATRTSNRKALNDLLYSPNKKESIGVSNRNDLKSNHLKKRTSISLPDICSQALNSNTFNSSFNRSEASTPNKSSSFKSANTPALKLNKRNNISVILEEKENPNLAFGIHLDKNLKGSISKLEKLASSDECLVSVKKEKKVEYKETGIQCNKGQEDMLFSESVDNTPFWKLMAHKRLKCLIKTELENSEVNIKYFYLKFE
jgi:hypothetical protein